MIKKVMPPFQGHECASMIKKAMPPFPLHLIDHVIIPIHIGNNHWFPAHVNIKEHQMTFLDSLHSYSSKCQARHEMIVWKFYRIIGNNHWFPAHVNIKEQHMTFLDSQHSYSSKCHARHEMIVWKFYRMAWEKNVAKEFPLPNWYLSPVDFTRPENWLLGITLVMAQVLKKHQKLTVQVVTEVVGDFIIKKWKRQVNCLWQEIFLRHFATKLDGTKPT